MLYIQGLHYTVKNRALITNLDLYVTKGEFVSIVGANGAGKSTLLKLIAGELEANSGSLSIKGENIELYSIKELAEFRGYLHQSNMMEIPFTVEEVIAMGRYRLNRQHQDTKIVEECIGICELENLRSRSIKQLSGGEQQRVHLARVLAQLWDVKDGILLLDEPISSMDIQYQHLTLTIMKAFAQKGFTIITVLHDLNLVAQYSDRVLMLKNGRAWWYGTPQEVLKQQNIYSIFGVDSTIAIDALTLTTQVQVIPRSMELHEFNSYLIDEVI